MAVGTAQTQGTPTKTVSEARADTAWWQYVLLYWFR